MDKLQMKSANGVQDNIKKIEALFPDCVTETIDADGKLVRKIDFEKLQQNLSDYLISDKEERYQFTWPDKKKAVLLANAPINATLRPCREESVDFDNTQNLYIEGDNLDVLKCLKETYLHKVKMIYIDPPYNTGNDFVYEDDFAVSAEEYRDRSGQYDEQGRRLVANTESNGRFHTDWLNMIYPRLKVARDLLTDDGVIFISIDDNEQKNLKNICDEVFGEDNFIAKFVWAAGRKNDSKYVSVSHEYIYCYVKSINHLRENKVIWRERKQGLDDIYAQYEKLKKVYGTDYTSMTKELKAWYKALPDSHPAKDHKHYDRVDSHGIYFPDNISWPGGGGPKYEVLHPITNKPVIVPSRGWITNKETLSKWIAEDRVQFGETESTVPCIKSYLKDRETSVPYSVFYKDGRASTKRLMNLFGSKVFENPKDEDIIQRLIDFTDTKDSLILDFFSGSATTAHAVMQLNAEDGGNRKFILVQLPEATEEKSEAYKAGYINICEIGKERIRRAGKKILEEQKAKSLDGTLFDEQDKANKLDTGFRVLKLDSTNMQDIYYSPADTNQADLFNMVDNVKPDRSPEDLLFQVMLELGATLDSKIERMTIEGKSVFNVANGFIVACFDKDVSDKVVTAIAKKQPLYAVIRDTSMADDSTATNFEQLFKTYSPNTTIKIL